MASCAHVTCDLYDTDVCIRRGSRSRMCVVGEGFEVGFVEERSGAADRVLHLASTALREAAWDERERYSFEGYHYHCRKLI